MNVEKIIIIHYTPLVERKEYLQGWFHTNNVQNFFFKADCDRENLTGDVIQQWATDVAKKRLDKGTMAVNIAWWQTINGIANGQDELVLVLEDDAIFCDDFLPRFNDALKTLPEDFEIGWLVDGFGFKIKREFLREDCVWYRAPRQNRTTGAVLLKKSAAQKIIAAYPRFDIVVDAQITEICHALHLGSYWMEPALITQGTQRGVYGSALRNFTFRFDDPLYAKVYTEEKTCFAPEDN